VHITSILHPYQHPVEIDDPVIASTSATNTEAGLRDCVRELHDRGMCRARMGRAGHNAAVDVRRVSHALKVGYWTKSVPFIDGCYVRARSS